MVLAALKVAYCPRCDRPKWRRTKVLALRAVEDHMKKAHRAYWLSLQEDK